MGGASSLRERYKMATRLELARAAFRLAIERGLDNVRVTDIATEAGVSPRTFNNYFRSKEEAIVALAAEGAARTGTALRERPVEEPLGTAVVESVAERYAGSSERAKDPVWLGGFRLMVSEPALRGEYLKAVVAMERALAQAIAERAGAEPGELFPQVFAAVVAGAERVALGHWLGSDRSVPLVDVVRQAVTHAVAGIQV